MRALAHIETISCLDPIPGADRIERATVLGWHLVVKNGEFKVGDACVYVEVDSILPEKPEFEFLRERKFRVKTIKLRGQISQGICFPLSILGPVQVAKGDIEGRDVTDLLGIKKYDPEGDAERAREESVKQTRLGRIDKYLRRSAWYRRLFPKTKAHGGNPKLPEFIKKTDEERVQNLTNQYEVWKKTQPFVVTEKIDGQSGTYFVVKKKLLFWTTYRFGICSRNFELPTRQGSYWQHADAVDMRSIMLQLAKRYAYATTIVLQGELAGPGIQGNKYGLTDLRFFAFNLILDGERTNYFQMRDSLTCFGVECVPLVNPYAYWLPETIDELLEYADGKSRIGVTPREGLVLRSDDISFKAISNEFLLKYGG